MSSLKLLLVSSVMNFKRFVCREVLERKEKKLIAGVVRDDLETNH